MKKELMVVCILLCLSRTNAFGQDLDELNSQTEPSIQIDTVYGTPNLGLTAIGKVTCSGLNETMTARDFQDSVNANGISVNRCYVKELTKVTNLKGRMTVSITVNAAGKVSKVQVIESSLGDNVNQCVTNRIRSWRFRQFQKGSVSLSVKFLFSK